MYSSVYPCYVRNSVTSFYGVSSVSFLVNTED